MKIDPNVDMTTPAVEQVNSLAAADYFASAAELMKVNPPHATDWSMLARLRRIGLEPGEAFDSQAVGPAVREAIDAAPTAAQLAMQTKFPTIAPRVNGWQMSAETMGVYGNSYLKRATLAMIGLGSNPPEDAIYPLTFVDGDGQPLDGDNRYRYSTAVDTRDWSLLDTVFSLDACLDYRSAGGFRGPYGEVRAWLAEVLPVFTWTQHLVVNRAVQLEGRGGGDLCVHLPQPQRALIEGEPWLFTVGGRYHDRLARLPTADDHRPREVPTWWENPMPGLPPVPYPCRGRAE